jgi:hypothetical protein
MEMWVQVAHPGIPTASRDLDGLFGQLHSLGHLTPRVGGHGQGLRIEAGG